MHDHSPHSRYYNGLGRSVYGFALMIISILLLVLFLVFAFTPDTTLISIGITFYPDKSWFLIVPTVLCTIIVLYLFVILPLMNFSLSAPLHSINLVRDSNTRHFDHGNQNQQSINNQSTNVSRIPPVSDMKIRDVCQKLYYDESTLKTE